MTTTLEQLRKEADPFGARVLPDGRTRFRIWVPQQERIIPAGQGNPRIYLADRDESLPMEHVGEGWYELVTDRAAHGARYQVELWEAFHGMGDPHWHRYPDPASMQQEKDSAGNSVVFDPARLDRSGEPPEWRGVAQKDLVFYEMHIDTITAEGTFKEAEQVLPYLKELGITAINVMPVEATGYRDNWGYDGVLKFAPQPEYGTPQEMADFIAAAHRHGIAVFLDEVDNHFGGEHNWLWLHTPEFMRFADASAPADKRETELDTGWGPALDMRRWEVRTFLRQKNRHMMEAYSIDGARRDAVHAIKDTPHEADPSRPHLLEEFIADAKLGFIHVLENEDDRPSLLNPSPAPGERICGNAQWGDNLHHAVRALMFEGQHDKDPLARGHLKPYIDNDPLGLLAEILSTGYAFSLETARTKHTTDADRAAPYDPRKLVFFTRNHDQIGNTPKGQRPEELLQDDPFLKEKLKFEAAILLLNPGLPMLFQGQEQAVTNRFPFLQVPRGAVPADDGRDANEGRKKELAAFADMEFADPRSPDSVAIAKLDLPGGQGDTAMLQLYKDLIRVRKEKIVPHLDSGLAETKIDRFGDGLRIEWAFGDGATFGLTLNAGNGFAPVPASGLGQSRLKIHDDFKRSTASLPPWSISWTASPAPDLTPAAKSAPEIRPV